ncbi:MAG: oligosaccharide flippase family protein [Pirellulaceae bacterium]
MAPSSPELIHWVRRGTRTVLLAQVASQIVSIGVLAIMLRLVEPAEYGLLGMILPAVMLPRMAALLGLSTAVLQRDLSSDQLAGLFWLNAVWGLVAAAVTAACGLWLSEAWDEPQLAPLCLALAGATLIAALGSQHQALLERKLLLGPLAGIRLLALACGGFAGIYTARRGAGVWALVAQQYAELLVLSVWVWLVEPWRPGWPKRGGEQAIGLVRFSTYYSLSQLAYYTAQNLDKILLPVLLGARAAPAVGLYSQAFSLMMRPALLLTSPLTGVMVAGLSQASHDRAAHAALVARFFHLVGVGLFPCAAGLLVVAPDVMVVLGGSQWQGAGGVLAALAPALFVQGMINVSMHVLAAAGKSGRLLVATVLLCLLLLPGTLAGFFLGRAYLGSSLGDEVRGATIGLAIGYTSVLVMVWFIPYLWFCLGSAGVRPWAVLRPLWPALRASLLMGLVVGGLTLFPAVQSLAPLPRLGLLVAAGAACYLLLAWREIAWWWHELVHLRDAPPAIP